MIKKRKKKKRKSKQIRDGKEFNLLKMIKEEFMTKTEADKHFKEKPGIGQSKKQKKFQNSMVPS